MVRMTRRPLGRGKGNDNYFSKFMDATAGVGEEERREAELDRWYFGRASNRRFAGLEGRSAVAPAGGKTAGRKKKQAEKQAPKGVAPTDETEWQGSFFFLQLADTQFGFYTENQVTLPAPLFASAFFSYSCWRGSRGRRR
jgi:hypothetical protein